ncbi:MAG: TolC family protein [Cyclobacteriaceae bacterium]|nr:TolC family protein [Cyclobacteriaceae bacterium]MCH8517037.1 TolC family protein [Cyclobacteriaceae bacterium]
MEKTILLYFFALLICLPLMGQGNDTLKINLDEAIDLARRQSPQYRIIVARQENQYWQYQLFKSNYLPQLRANATLPSFNRSVNVVQQPDGAEFFREVSRLDNQFGLSMSQTITATGAEVFLNSNLRRIDNFEPIQNFQYNSQPVFIGINQPLFAFNQLKWDKKVEPLRFEVSKKIFNQDMELIGRNVSDIYFDLLLAQTRYDLATNNRKANETLFNITERRYQLGKANEEDLLQIELQLINSEQEERAASADLANQSLSLAVLIGLSGSENIIVSNIDNVPNLIVEEEIALAYALENNPNPMDFELRIREAEREVARAKGETGLVGNLQANIGLTQFVENEAIGQAFINPLDQQVVNLQFSMPILDWGRMKARRRVASVQLEVEAANVYQEKLNFEQELRTQIRRIAIIKGQFESSQRARQIADRRWQLAQNRFEQAQISITDLNIAREEKDRAATSYITAAKDFWVAYYDLRAITLHDFEQGKNIDYYEFDWQGESVLD